MANAEDLNEEPLKLDIPSEEAKLAVEAVNLKTVDGEAKQTEENALSNSVHVSSSKHKSDIFFLETDKQTVSPPQKSSESQPPRRLNKLRDHTSTIFPAGCMGCREDPPSDHIVSPRRFLDATEAKDHVGHMDNTPRKRPSSAKPCNTRNPLTGVGMNTNEIKRHSSRRKDGNPLLGEGYDNKNVTPSSTRIPPGGYSQGLW